MQLAMATYQSSKSNSAQTIPRRSAPYKPPIWDLDYVQSITSEYHQGEPYASQMKELKDKVKIMLKDDVTNHLAKLEQVDMLQRLGVSYHFESEIESFLKDLFKNIDSCKDLWKQNLYATALQFRLQRQHQYVPPQEVFSIFMEETGSFKPSIVEDVIGMLNLYEASFLTHPNEDILEEARVFTTKHLEEYIKNIKKIEETNYLTKLVARALDVPLHWRESRFEVRWFIDIYRKMPQMNPTFLELAILDFNILQSIYLQELKEAYSLWMECGLGQKLEFGRDRLVENHLWATLVSFEPKYGYFRKFSSICYSILTLIDDIYDTYGALDELVLFTNAFESWDMKAMDSLPNYMKLCFLAFFNFTNELAYRVLKEKEHHVIKYLKKWAADLCRSYFVEAKWFDAKITPTFEEYIENGWISFTAPMIIAYSYCCVANPITEEALEALENYPSIIHQSSLICRIINDISTSPFEVAKGDNPKAVECYMHETSASKEETHRHMHFLVREAWKMMNKDRADQNAPFTREFHELVTNIARSTFWVYHTRDGFGFETDVITKDSAELLFAKPIPFGVDDNGAVK